VIHTPGEVRPIEGLYDGFRVAKAKVAGHIISHRRRGRSRQSNNRTRQTITHLRDLSVRGPKIVPPLRNAVGFIHSQKPDVTGLDQLEKWGQAQSFWSHK
jgi:hypothetical protein